MANGIYKITEDFEKSLSDYTGAPYVITVDNQSNALFLSLYYEKNIHFSKHFTESFKQCFKYKKIIIDTKYSIDLDSSDSLDIEDINIIN